MVPFGWKIVLNAVGLWIVDALWSSMRIIPQDASILTQIAIYLVLGLVLALVNLVIKPLVKVISLPLYILTLGLFGLIVNAAMLELVSWVTSLTSFGLEIDTFPTAIGAGLVLALLTAILSVPFKRRPAQ
ncbi:MAG: phage holin family protein [Bifidobacteriaceae bacterium]|jgi:putative membrane protein|nr:phage holin family protein [Bifidobacteriaceae bacterium]